VSLAAGPVDDAALDALHRPWAHATRGIESAWGKSVLTADPLAAALASRFGWGGSGVSLDRSRGAQGRARLGQVFTPAPVAAALANWTGVAERDRPPLVLDPACGDGALLVAALDARRAAGWQVDEAAQAMIGIDKDPSAVVVARAQLVRWAEVHGATTIPEIRCVDALEGPAAALVGAPVGTLLANPPYLEAKRMGAGAPWVAALRAQEPTLSGAFDLYLAFCVRALAQIDPAGAAGLLLPNKVLVARYAAAFRRMADARVAAVIDAAHVQPRVFPGTGVYPAVVVLRGAPTARRVARVSRPDDWAAPPWQPAPAPLAAPDHPWFVPDPTIWPLIRDIQGAHRLGEVATVRSTCSFHARGLRERFVGPERPEGLAFPYLGGPSRAARTEVRPFALAWAGWWIRWDPQTLAALGNSLPPRDVFQQPKVVLCQHGRRMSVWVDADGRFVTKDVYPVAAPAAPDWDVWTLGGVMGSSVFTLWYNQVYHGVTCGSWTYHYLPSWLKGVPVPPRVALEGVGALVRRAQGTGEQADRVAVDRAVALAYGLDEAAWARCWARVEGALDPTSPPGPHPK